MLVAIVDDECLVYKEPGDPVFRPNWSKKSWSALGWYAAESRLLYGVQKILRRRGYDVIKKRMHRDGHMFGSDEMQYIRMRSFKAPAFYIVHFNYALEVAAAMFNVCGRIGLDVVYEVEPDNQNCGEITRKYVREIEEKQPQVYEVSWTAERKVDHEVHKVRCYRAFTNHVFALVAFDMAQNANDTSDAKLHEVRSWKSKE